jgi:zinc ribbon protein
VAHHRVPQHDRAAVTPSMEKDPDYTQCTLEELLDVQQRIDRQAYPARAAAVDREISRRGLEAGRETSPREAVPVRLGEPVAVKPGRASSFLGVVASLGVSLIGIVMLFKAFKEDDWYQILFLIVFCVIAVSGLFYNAYNAFGRNRFSEHDVVSPQQEPDPFASALGYEGRAAEGKPTRVRRYPGSHCPYCGAAAPDTADFCPACGKDI